MKVVYKHLIPELAWRSPALLDLPRGSRILKVAEQAGDLLLWALCHPQQEETETRHVVVLATGERVEDESPKSQVIHGFTPDGRWPLGTPYQETVLMKSGLVWHVWVTADDRHARR